jgi:hypothetical protein
MNSTSNMLTSIFPKDEEFKQLMSENPIKIRMALSGEMRTWNKEMRIDGHLNPRDFHLRLSDLLYENLGIDVFFSGHTWQHCSDQIKQRDIELFDNIEVSDQTEIDDWVMEKTWERYPHKGEDPTDMALCRATYGQIASTQNCFNSIDAGDYSTFIIRSRWDNGYTGSWASPEYLMTSTLTMLIQEHLDLIKLDEEQKKYYYRLYMGPETKLSYNSNVSFEQRTFRFSPADTYFGLNHPLFKKIHGMHWQKAMTRVTQNYVKSQHVPNSHSLWGDYMTANWMHIRENNMDIPTAIRFGFTQPPDLVREHDGNQFKKWKWAPKND